jgi:hypothetical protein
VPGNRRCSTRQKFPLRLVAWPLLYGALTWWGFFQFIRSTSNSVGMVIVIRKT